MSKDGRIWLSHSGLETLERCPRCFWLQYKRGIRQPEGIVSRLANRFDSVLKIYFQKFRGSGDLPPMISGRLEGILQNPFQEKYFITLDDRYGFWGKLDECLVNEKGEHLPVDFKTASSDPRDKEILAAYQSQIDDYIFLLSQEGKKVSGFGYLIFVYPDEGGELHNGFPMIIYVKKVEGQPQRTKDRLKKAIAVLEKQMPKSNPDCSFCNWYETIKAQLKPVKNIGILASAIKPTQPKLMGFEKE